MKRRPLSEQERRRQALALRLPARFGPKPFRPRSLWFFDIHRTRWRPSVPKSRRLERAQRFASKYLGDHHAV